ncbi:Glutamine-dependent NAD(+) synthetase [Candidatus Magnetomoraceae bacterium gMMP-15]
MKTALAQINPIIGNFNYNIEKMMTCIEKAKALSCDLVVFSELVISGYPPRDLLEKKDFVQCCCSCLYKLMYSTQGIGIICGFPEENPNKGGNPLYNSAVLFEDGEILHKVRKRLLPTYDIFDERRYFEPGTSCSSFTYKGNKIGLTICEDLWNDKDFFEDRIYPLDPVDLMIADGADLIINISASPFHVGKRSLKKNMLKSLAKKYNIPFLYVNQVGGNDSILFDGTSAVFDENGKIRALCDEFKEDLVVFDTETQRGEIHPVPLEETESILKALVMGTRDYVTKCGFKKVVVGLSGGIDSALTAVIGVMALGKENVSAVFMPSPYTAPDNFDDTKKLTENLGIKLDYVPINDIFKKFLTQLGSDFNNINPDISEQNIQARIRGTILMAFSNKHGSIVLTTGNKSELAVGYCTLYGDMNGGLAVISDVPKTMAYELSRLINQDKEIIPINIIEKAPSAELKPDQKDQDELPPYNILDDILKLYIEDLKSMHEIIEMGFDKDLVIDIIRRVERNEYKRYQAAPGLKVTSKAFGYGRRYPIAQGYY